jgi:uncharacterized protein
MMATKDFSLPDVIPIFPLGGAVLLPRAQLPLNIFEPRYVAMTRDVMATHRIIGMVQPTNGGARPAVYPVGCAGRISAAEDSQDGRIMLTLSGLKRFHIVEELATTTPYRQVRIDYTGFEHDDSDAHVLIGDTRIHLLDRMHDYLKALGLDADWTAIEKANDDMLVSALTMLCPFENAEKQALLEAPKVQDRAQVLMTLMAFVTQSQSGSPPVRH